MEFDSPKKNKKHRKSYLLSCFGFSIIEKEFLSVNKSIKKKNKSKLFSFSKILRKNSSAAKTIPVDISDKFDNRSKEIHVVKSEKVKTPSIAGDVTQAPAIKSQSQTNIHEKDIKKKKDHKTKDMIHKKNKSLDKLLDKVRDSSTCQDNFSRSITISGSLNMNHLIKNPTKDKHEIKLSHSKSLPPQKQKNPEKKVNDDKKSRQRREDVLSDDNFDSIMGMSILMVTLLIMLFWGKACAIVCTCAWFYFLPRFRTKNEAVIAGKIDGVAGDVDRNSEEYKKKVVLEGFLERNHRNGVGFL
ncbi:uncharacterized protein At5g23160 [Solanum pennellii]|uniref:Uncharacterized protein At5g23160 n=1 Tax=Solanum pennellii TaxID=28526 RepID=A0ABM1GLJ9_SOLPN|nr:uncharacterized protein At5g23160 [Solanum pennellii]